MLAENLRDADADGLRARDRIPEADIATHVWRGTLPTATWPARLRLIASITCTRDWLCAVTYTSRPSTSKDTARGPPGTAIVAITARAGSDSTDTLPEEKLLT